MAKGVDIVLAMGGPKKPPGADDAEPDYSPDSGSEDLPEEYAAAYRDYQKDPNPQTMWDMIEACVSAGKVSSDMKAKKNFGPYSHDD